MRILVAALGAPGHAFPLVPLARALHDAGHDVTFATGPDLEPVIATSGVPTTAVGRPATEAFREVMIGRGLTERPSDQEVMREVASEVFGAVLPRSVAGDLVPRLREQPPDVVVAEVGDPGAALAARVLGVPCVLHSFGRRPSPVAPMSVTVPARLATVAAELAVPLAEGDALGHAYLDLCPPSLQEPDSVAHLAGLTELPLRPVAWNPPTPFAPRRLTGRPWVLLTLGTSFGEAGVLRTALDGLSALDVDVLVAAGSVDAGELAGLERRGVQVESFVPQADLLRGAVDGVAAPPALVVHHGGSGTTLACAGAGVPQVLLPQGADQFSNAQAVTTVGAGVQLRGDEVTGEAVTAAVTALLGGGRELAAARALAAEVAALPAPDEVAARVERWAVPGQPAI
ncbi:glycosyltransferase [Actinomycetospora sp. TBRC 11914]|uniref:glycosyltransferase n=1 Tax=Actinomycetospora sp. TBRC 11914 TaxID=2729387 RepID=UPI00145FAF8F|nr:glycosyltransferase [Actinomycetospora sp. TBRC 11914]NMO89307.1 glycosyltransferase family 1 protein [Actinomycetospora sp. TBRC 11914]